jgi:dolichol-phosphate mannosyltransferase
MLSVIIPVYNEANNIKELATRLNQTLAGLPEDWEVLFINDGSRDGSWEMLEGLAKTDKRIKLINFSRNFGHQNALAAGIDHCQGKAAIIMDGDLQDPPELIPELFAKWKQGYHVVYAQRTSREYEPASKRFFAGVFYRLIKRITSLDMPLDTGDFRLIDRRVIDILKNLPENNLFLRGLVAWTGFRQTGVQFNRERRYAGKPKYSFKKSLELAIAGITSFSVFPLRLASYLGFLVSGFSFLFALYVIYKKFFLDVATEGWASLMVVILFLGGVQLLTLGIIGEYLGKLNEEQKKRPKYIVADKVNF